MKKLNFDELNDEAKNLIYNHVPHAAQMSTIREGSSSEMSTKGSTDNPEADLLNHKEYDSDSSSSPTSKPHKKGHNSHQSSLSFYAPNPDLTLRRDDQPEYDNQDDFLLDENEDSYVPPPKQVHAGVLSSLLKLYQNPQASKSASSFGTSRSFGGSTYGSRVPTLAEENEYDESLNLAGSKSTSTVDFSKFKDSLKNAPSHFSSKAYKATHKLGGKKNRERVQDSSDEDQGMYDEKDSDGVRLPSFQNARPKQPKRQAPVPKVSDFKKLANHKKEQQLRITVHIADILQRQRFIMRMCRALMLFGAPTHRLEEYMIMTSRVLEIDGQFIYFPGCMIVSFGDASTRTSEVHLVKCAQGLNLSKLSDTHKIYKGVIHDLIGVEDASKRIEDLLKKKNLYPPWLCVLIYGLGSAAVCPFAFGGGWVDIPISFGVGCCVGYLQFYLASMSNLYSSVFEVTASIVVSFISRGIGSIKGGRIFCFAAIAQGSLALILPGYIILCGSLELQSRNLVAGSVRMFYAIIYSLFLGFGITLGAALYGWVDKKSVSANSCDAGHSLDDKWKILFVPMFSISLALINQSRWQQLPVMLIISGIGYIGNYFAGKHFSQVTEFTACIGAFIIGVLGNLYSRIWKGMAVSAMLPAIFVQVPSGIASKSSLISGIQTADQITKGNSTTSANTANGVFDASSLSFGATMVEVSIGISVGLFAAALVVYPFGKKKTGLFTL
ncbi:pheromone-regulated membrane [Scheffersomyces xylosifermentans]|uniref:pheromone-regulated membrane n=1 Tax=Scheffersomyces xylosifermentans TaxID=1304137 RepID=UPI00315DD87B